MAPSRGLLAMTASSLRAQRSNPDLPSSIHRVEEFGVALRFLELVDQELEAVDGAHRGQNAAQYPHLRQDTAIDEQFLLASAGFGDVDRREGALVGDLAVENDLRIAGALELFEDHLVHARAGVDQRGCDDRQ